MPPSPSPPATPNPSEPKQAPPGQTPPGQAPPGQAPRPSRLRFWRKPLMVTTIIACILHLPFTPAVPFLRMLERLAILRDSDKNWDYHPTDVSLPIELLDMPKVEPPPSGDDNSVALPPPATPGPKSPTGGPGEAGKPTKPEATKAEKEREKKQEKADEKSRDKKREAEKEREKKQERAEKKAKTDRPEKAAKADKPEKAGPVKFAQSEGDEEKPVDGEPPPADGERSPDGTRAPAPASSRKVAEAKSPKGPEVVGLKGKLSEGLVGKPNVTVALWMPDIRAHRLGPAVNEMMSCSPDWRPFLQRGIKPLDDIEGFMAVGPQIASSAQMTVAVQHHVPDDQIKGLIDALVQRSGPAGAWLVDDAAKIVVQRRERVMFPHPRDMLFVAPVDGWRAVHDMKEPVSLPPSRGRAASVTLLRPARPLRKLGIELPERLAELRLDVFANSDGSVDLRVDIDDASDEAAAADLARVGRAFELFFGDLSQVAATVGSFAPGVEGGQLTLPRPDFAQVGKRLTATLRVMPAQTGTMLAILGKVVCPKKAAGGQRAPATP